MEGEKAIGGAGNDSNNIISDMRSVMLKEIEDNKYKGILLVGVPGAAKTLCARATADELGAKMLCADISATQNSLVGESGRRFREMWRSVKSVTQPSANSTALIVMTCNNIAILPPEIKRRFPVIFFADIPTKDELPAIWKLQIANYGLRKDQITKVDDTDWTGAEVRNCCDFAWMLDCTLKEASKFVVPVAKMAPEVIDRLRKEANGRYLSMSKVGVYTNKLAAATWSDEAVDKVRKLG